MTRWTRRRAARRASWMLGLILACAIGGRLLTAQGPAPSPLQRLVEAELAQFPGTAGVHVQHLTKGDEAAVAADEAFNSASVIKIPILVLAYELAERKELDLDGRVAIAKPDIRAGSGIFRYHDPGLSPTWRDVLREMIITSDNTATDLAIRKVGGVERVNAWLADHGFRQSRLNKTIFDAFRDRYAVLDPELGAMTAEDLYAVQSSNPSWATSSAIVDRVQALLAKKPMQAEWNRLIREAPATWFGVATPREIGRLLAGIERGSYVSKAACDEMKAMLRQQQSGARRLPHYVEVAVGHKTGDLPPMVANDVGILYARSGPIVVSFFSNAIRGPYGEAEDRIGELARAIVAHFDRDSEPRD